MMPFLSFILIILFLSTVSTQQCSENWNSFSIKKGSTEFLTIDESTNTVVINKLNAKTQVVINGVNVLSKISSLESTINSLEADVNSLESTVNTLKNAPTPRLSRRLVRNAAVSKRATVTAQCNSGEIAVSCDIRGHITCDPSGTATFRYTDTRTCSCSCSSGTANWSTACSTNCLKIV